MTDLTSKACTCCHVTKPLDEFIQHGGKSFYTCRECTEKLTTELRVTDDGRLCYRCGYRRPDEAFETQPRGEGLRIVCRSCRGGSPKYKEMGVPSKALLAIEEKAFERIHTKIRAEYPVSSKDEQILNLQRVNDNQRSVIEEYRAETLLAGKERSALETQISELRDSFGHAMDKYGDSQERLGMAEHHLQALNTILEADLVLTQAKLKSASKHVDLLKASNIALADELELTHQQLQTDTHEAAARQRFEYEETIPSRNFFEAVWSAIFSSKERKAS